MTKVFNFIPHQRQHQYQEYKTLEETSEALFKAQRTIEELQQELEEALLEAAVTRGKMFEYKAQVMHLNKALAKKNRKNKSLNERVTSQKVLLKAFGEKSPPAGKSSSR